MPKYVMHLTVETDCEHEVPNFEAKGDIDVVLDVMGSLQGPLNDATTCVAHVEFYKKVELTPQQEAHGRRIAERGRHNGTSEA